MSAYAKTYESNPELWTEGSSFLIKAEEKNGDQVILASGWHRRSIAFENANTLTFDELDRGIGLIRITKNEDGSSSICKTQQAPYDWSQIICFEMEISLDGDKAHDAEVLSVLSRLIQPESAQAIFQSMSTMIQRISANRANTSIECEEFGVLQSVDFLCQNFPARSGNLDEPMRILHRWCRVIETPKGTITLYQPIADHQKSNLRWPHNGIWLNRGPDYYQSHTEKIGDIQNAVKIPILYEEYNLENWRVEFEYWENQAFQIMLNEASFEASDRLRRTQNELGILSDFIMTAFMAVRVLKHRSECNPLLKSTDELHQMVLRHVDLLRGDIEEYRELLMNGSALLANVAQSVQAVASQESAIAAERTNTFITYASAVFFIPSLIISFFSMSIIGLETNDVVPSMLTVLFICIASVAVGIISLVVLRLLLAHSRRKQIRK